MSHYATGTSTTAPLHQHAPAFGTTKSRRQNILGTILVLETFLPASTRLSVWGLLNIRDNIRVPFAVVAQRIQRISRQIRSMEIATSSATVAALTPVESAFESYPHFAK